MHKPHLRPGSFGGLKMWKRCVQPVHATVQKPQVAHKMYAVISRALLPSTSYPKSSPRLTTTLPPALSTTNSPVFYLLERTYPRYTQTL
jgi:hypothetical protein